MSLASRKSNESKYSLESASTKMVLVCPAGFSPATGPGSPSSRPSQGLILLPGAWNVYLAGACRLPHWGPNLGPYENCCKIFKSKALKIYVSHRLAGHRRGRDPGDHGEDDEGDGHVRPVDLYKRSL